MVALETLLVQGKSIPYRRGSVPVSDCLLDPQNPRIQFLVGQKAGNATQTELDGLIWEKDTVKALAQSIQQNGGVYEAIIVQRTGEQYLVREGNCRTVSARHLLDQYPNDSRFMTIPAMIFDSDLTEEDLAVLLADMHVSGKIRWDAYEQAKHIADLYHVYGKTYDWLGNHLRLSKSKINEMLLAHAATKEFLQHHPEPVNVRKFSFFHELMKKRDLREQFKEDPEFKQKFHKWLAEGKLTDAKQVRNLPAILESADAAAALDKTGIDDASRVLIKNDPSLESDLFQAVKRASEQLRKAPASEIQDLKGGNPQKIIMIRDLSRAIEDLYTLAGMQK
ncbi:hypothetical protein [Tunturiibacter gelidoferens]|uniref:ParB/Sulfiredoxin domain-containing protein n=1 Tax=Tunturiibacter lichenicola TaxID=2051959 RepID=A0A7Y9NR87_9BACT|nr:hypothetical protein [Edaphobacter lichenicola]NYF54066.1 hypothetical protein [Edaphobacter lichenicola]